MRNLKKSIAGLVIVQGQDMGKDFLIRKRSVEIGRAENADIPLRDKRISRIHAKIDVGYSPERKLQFYRITDLGSTNHVYVNGNEVGSCLLESGDKIQLGDTILKFELQDSIDAKFHSDIRQKIKYDALTQLLTMESFREAMNWEIDLARERNRGFAILMMDLDDFKKVNDTHGHVTGSNVLREVGGLINSSLRPFDISARYGGEEFVSCLPDTERADAIVSAERLRAAIAAHNFKSDDKGFIVTISIGISRFPENGHTIEDLIKSADEMLYNAKRTGKNRVVAAE